MRRTGVRPRDGLVPAAFELAALTGAAVAQPLLDEFGRAPDVFIRAGVGRWGVVAFALIVALAPLGALVLLEALVVGVGGEPVRRIVHVLLVAGLVALFAVRALRTTLAWRGDALLVAALTIAIATAVAHAAFAVVRSWLRLAAALPVVTVAVFLGLAPVSELVSGATSRPAVRDRPRTARSVVVLVLDEFPILSLLDPNGRIDARRYPNFALLARESAWFRNATSVGTHSFFAQPAILTGR